MMKPGSELNAEDKKYVLAAYVHRFTGDHKPAWANKPRPNGLLCPVQFANDADWLANTFFDVTKEGRVDRRISDCESHPTWPNNPELRKGV